MDNKKLLNNMNPSAYNAKLGDKIDALEAAVPTIPNYTIKVLAAGDISTGVATVTLDGTFLTPPNVLSAQVVSSAGAVRAITKIATNANEGAGTVALTVTSVAATDIVSVIYK